MARGFYCGSTKRMTKADAKLVSNFREFLAGRGQRCINCSHKASKHDMSGCSAKGCGCGDDNLQVLARRKWAAAPGWKDD